MRRLGPRPARRADGVRPVRAGLGLRSLLVHKLRSVLSILGVVFGVALNTATYGTGAFVVMNTGGACALADGPRVMVHDLPEHVVHPAAHATAPGASPAATGSLRSNPSRFRPARSSGVASGLAACSVLAAR